MRKDATGASVVVARLGDEYRNPPAADALDALANTKIHARDDCNKVIPATQHQLYLSSHFAKKTGVAIGSDKCISGGPYETLEEAGRACGKDDLCKGSRGRGAGFL